jgi:hypothetical protein
MPNYAKGKIYKLINTEGTLCYVGSTTTTLAQRKAEHRSKYKSWKNGKYKYTTSFKIFEDDEQGCEIVLIEDFPCNSKEELEKQERHYIESIECVNKHRPTRTYKEYAEANKDKIKQYKKEFYEQNKERYSLKASQKQLCECGTTHTAHHKLRHLKSLKHQQYIKSINPQQDA